MTGCRSNEGPARRQAGYTLIELLVALGVFSVVVIMIAGLITRLVFIERRDMGEQAIEEDVRFALEVFSREVRLAYAATFALPDDTGKSIVMRNQNGNCVNYRLSAENGTLERSEVSAGGTDCLSASFVGYAPLTSNLVVFDVLRFDIPDNVYNRGDNRLDRQGFVTMIIKARALNKATPPLELQTTVTSRQVKVFPTL
ncbi:MAG: prepilin-type N-terminal cleavage/methylation domain-containing protein [Patescibacteria group bacterium]